jgi:hypothetical protein
MACALAVAGLTVLATSSSASAAHRSSTERVIGFQNNPNRNGFAVIIAKGPIHARGRDKVIDGRHDLFIFPKGKLLVTHKTTAHHQTYDKKTCYGTFTQAGTYTIKGQGGYMGARGHGKFTVHASVVGCHTKGAKTIIFQLQLHARGPLTMGQ